MSAVGSFEGRRGWVGSIGKADRARTGGIPPVGKETDMEPWVWVIIAIAAVLFLLLLFRRRAGGGRRVVVRRGMPRRRRRI
jgi:hypothetical protein